MATAGYCSQCGAYVYLNEQWGCPQGHAWNAVSEWYDSETRMPITPPWLQAQQPVAAPAAQQAAAEAPAVARPAPEAAIPATEPAVPAPAPAPPPDPAVTLRQMLRARLQELNLTIAEEDGVLAVRRGDEYEAALAVDGHNGRILLWERLSAGRDPGVRDMVRALAGANWSVKVMLRRDGVR